MSWPHLPVGPETQPTMTRHTLAVSERRQGRAFERWGTRHSCATVGPDRGRLSAPQ